MSELDVVLNEIKNLNEKVDNYHKEFNEHIEKYNKFVIKTVIDITGLKFKSGVWGFAAGFIPAAIVAVYFMVKTK